MTSEREYLSEMDIFKVISESKPFKLEAKVYPEKGMSPKNDKSSPESQSPIDKLSAQKNTLSELQKNQSKVLN